MVPGLRLSSARKERDVSNPNNSANLFEDLKLTLNFKFIVFKPNWFTWLERQPFSWLTYVYTVFNIVITTAGLNNVYEPNNTLDTQLNA